MLSTAWHLCFFCVSLDSRVPESWFSRLGHRHGEDRFPQALPGAEHEVWTEARWRDPEPREGRAKEQLDVTLT